MQKDLVLRTFRTIALVFLIVGAFLSVKIVLYTGRKNTSFILPILFMLWVLSPFLLLFIANLFSKYWKEISTKMLYSLMILLSIGSVFCYSGGLQLPSNSKPAFIFLIVPFISWCLIGIGSLLMRKFERSKI